jgi:hypothetical protein
VNIAGEARAIHGMEFGCVAATGAKGCQGRPVDAPMRSFNCPAAEDGTRRRSAKNSFETPRAEGGDNPVGFRTREKYSPPVIVLRSGFRLNG